MNLVDIKGNITSKQRLVLMITFLIVIVVVFFALKSFHKESKGINYKKTDINKLLVSSKEVRDREIYWNLNEIIFKFLKSYDEYTDKDLNYYFKALDPNYKKYIGKKKYKELTLNVVDKVLGKDRDDFLQFPEPLIVQVNQLNEYDNAYLCQLSTINKEDAYIGVVLDIKNTKYNIFYIY